MVVNYRELQEQSAWPPRPGKWMSDPDRDPEEPYAPRPKYYLNGDFVRHGEKLRTRTSRVSFGEKNGLNGSHGGSSLEGNPSTGTL